MDAERIADLFSGFGAVAVKRMFGGQGIYADGVMFALVADGAIYLKADDPSVFEREGEAPFSHATKGGRRVALSYWRLPERLYDDPDELAVWARAAVAAAHRAAATARPKRSARPGLRRPGSAPR